MATGGKCKYLLYIASAVAADALANHRRCAGNFVHILCLSEEGDNLSMRLSAHQIHELNRCREHSSSL